MKMTGIRTRNETLLVGALLTFVGGFLDAYTFVGHAVFANAQTGNVVLFGVETASRHWHAALLRLIPIAAFVVGVVAAETLGRSHVRDGVRRPLRFCARRGNCHSGGRSLLAGQRASTRRDCARRLRRRSPVVNLSQHSAGVRIPERGRGLCPTVDRGPGPDSETARRPLRNCDGRLRGRSDGRRCLHQQFRHICGCRSGWRVAHHSCCRHSGNPPARTARGRRNRRGGRRETSMR